MLTTALEDALSGNGRLVLLAGEPGIGKTRMAHELAAYAGRRDANVLWGRCHEDRGAPPYWPWVQVIRSYAREHESDQLLSEMGSGASEIAEIVSDVKERLPDLQPSPPLETAEQARFHLFDSITTFFRNASQNQPLLVVLDNLHWADRPSLLLLEFMAREMGDARSLVLGTYRDSDISASHNLSATLGEVAREPLFQQIRLEGLSEKEVESFLHSAAQTEPPAELVEAVYAKTEGNPFFMTEVVRLLVQDGAFGSGISDPEGAAATDGLSLGIPDSVRLAIGRRISHLSQECHRTLTVASVIRREFGLDELGCLMDGEGSVELLGAMEEAIAARMIEEIPASVGRYQFEHVLIQETLADELSTLRRAELHARIGEVLEDLYDIDAGPHADELAYHFLRGGVIDKAAEYALMAGDRASAIYAWEQAIAQYETGVELLEKLEAGPRLQAETLEKLAHAAGMSKGKDFLTHLEMALSLYETLGDRLKTGAVLYQMSRLFSTGTGDWEVSHSYALKAVELLEPEGESVQLGRAYAQAGHTAAHLSGPISGAIALMENGLAMAEQLGNEVGATNAANHLAHALVYHAGEIERGLELHHRIWEIAKASNNPVASATVAFMLSSAYISLRDVDGAIQWSERGVEAAGIAGLMHRRLLCSLTLAQASILRGEVSRAFQGLEMAQEIAKKIDTDVGKLAAPRIIAEALVCFYLGDWSKAGEELLMCLASGKETHTVAVMQTAGCALGELYLEEGDLESANRYLLEAATVAEAKGEKTLEIAPRALLAQVAAKAGELNEARAHLSRVQEILSNGEDWRGLEAEVLHSEAIFATAEERWQQAEVAFRKAAEINRRYHLPYYEARCIMEWGHMRLSRNEPGDKQQGMELLDQALGIFQGIQAAKMVEKVVNLKEQSEQGPTK
ncbi:MAG: AAA family ATPase, partial [Chloroflexi bacterium]|nr:AAA family ATPase [Chloroflexota bacterium]